MTVTKRLRLRFRDSNERIVSFTINPPVEPVNLADVEELMDLIISTDLFYTYTGGQILKKLMPPCIPKKSSRLGSLNN